MHPVLSASPRGRPPGIGSGARADRVPSPWAALAGAVAVIAVTGLVRSDQKFATAPSWYWAMKTEWREQAQVVVAGDSRIYRGVNPQAFEARLGRRCVNFGFSGTGYEPRYLDAIERLLQRDERPVIVLGISAWSLTRRAAASNGFLDALQEHARSNVSAVTQARLEVISGRLVPFDFEFLLPARPLRRAGEDNYRQHYHLNGWVESDYRARDPARGLIVAVQDHRGNPVEPAIVAGLAQRIEKWTSAGWAVFAFVPPATPEVDALVAELSGFEEAGLRRAFEKAGARWLNVPRTVQASYDGTHLTAEAAQKLSLLLADQVADLLEIPANRK